uniref:Reverse transcriptase n=1 Tax=Chelydra serpentina TaxID=8475 RepID=A0A8C3T988_CHESE
MLKYFRRQTLPNSLIEATENMKVGKPLGPNGFPDEFYRHFLILLSDKNLKIFNESLLEGIFPPMLRKALISVIPKPGQNATLCFNHRSIPLINSDDKTLAKVLAMRLGKVLSSFIVPNQVRFVRGHHGSDNL